MLETSVLAAFAVTKGGCFSREQGRRWIVACLPASCSVPLLFAFFERDVGVIQQKHREVSVYYLGNPWACTARLHNSSRDRVVSCAVLTLWTRGDNCRGALAVELMAPLSRLTEVWGSHPD